MLGLPQNTEINIEIDVEELCERLYFNQRRKEVIAKKLLSMEITNQIDCKETKVYKNKSV